MTATKSPTHRRNTGSRGPARLLGAATLALGAGLASAEVGDSTLDLYGFAMLDTGYQSGQNDPDWFDVLRPTKLLCVFHLWDGIFAQLSSGANHAIRFGKYERLFDTARARVRAWERENAR